MAAEQFRDGPFYFYGGREGGERKGGVNNYQKDSCTEKSKGKNSCTARKRKQKVLKNPPDHSKTTSRRRRIFVLRNIAQKIANRDFIDAFECSKLNA